MKEPETNEEYLELFNCLNEQLVENIVTAETPYEIASTWSWYLNQHRVLMNQYYNKTIGVE